MYSPSPTETDALILFGVAAALAVATKIEDYRQHRREKAKREMMQSIERRLKAHE